MSQGQDDFSATHMEEAPAPVVRTVTVVSAVSGFGSSSSFGRGVSARVDELLSIELVPADVPAKPSHGRVRRKSEGHVGKLPASRLDRDDTNVNASAASPRRNSDPCNRMCKVSELLPAQPGSEWEVDSEREEYIRKMRLLSLQAGLPAMQVHNFGETMVGSSVGDSRRSSRTSSRRPSVVASPVETEPGVEDPLAALIRQMGAAPVNETSKKKTTSRRPSQVVLSHAAMSHLSEIKRPATAQSMQSTRPPTAQSMQSTRPPTAQSMQSMATRAPQTSDGATLSAPCSTSPAETPNRGLLALLRRRQNGGHSQAKQKQQAIPGDLSWRKCKRPVVNGSSIKVGKAGQADAGSQAACILLSNTGLEVFSPSMIPM